ncbi:MAG TPA: DUF1579 family protein [Dyella sp.]|uniref:DUF1579 family protein n=1 Tax=Dyella sp. TaxID=1869338 RepID=UPI002D795C74|nr:DUF1579 family protein [Dyella sp.]HET6552021.1 DUF1579 family protein [Dyella sp.]
MTMLEALAGEWSGDEEIATTRWGQGGPATGFIKARIDLGGRALVQDYREERDGKLSLQAHAVFVAGPEHDQYSLYWFDSYGFVPGAPAPGLWDGQRLTFVRSSPRGQTRHIYAFEGEDVLTLRLESSFDGGVSWERVMDGRYRRVAG